MLGLTPQRRKEAELTKVLFVFGTRPEAIKLCPLVKKMEEHTEKFNVKVCVTAQHREMLDQVLGFFRVKPDYDLDIMSANQTLFDVTGKGLKGLEKVIEEAHPDLIIVQGDTTTAFIGALAGYYKRIKVAHVEAGLRSGDKYSPFPEEANRILAGHLADFHFAPTEKAKQNLQKEGIVNNVYVVGNTVIDALFDGLERVKKEDEIFAKDFSFIDFSKKVILVTGHRRESFGEPFENICKALKMIAEEHPYVELVYPVHLNPNVRKPVNKILGGQERIHLIEPLDYPHLIWLMDKSYLVVTDSGGIQEEAPSLGKPVIVMRDVTERIEGIEAGTAKLVGTLPHAIIYEVNWLLEDEKHYQRMANAVNPYGDGKACEKIVRVLSDQTEVE